jgi:FlaA1/EpsC-like NDP-sugar epimerase
MASLKISASSERYFVAKSLLFASFQGVLIFCSLCIAWLLRFDFSLPYRTVLFSALPVLIAIRLAAIARFKLLHGWWRYTGLSDIVDLLKAITLGSVVFLVVMRFVLAITLFPRSIYFLETLVSMALLVGIRVCSRMFAESTRKDGAAKALLAGIRAFSQVLAESARKDDSAKRVIVIGAGFASQMVIRETKRPGCSYRVVGCVDDDPSKMGIRIHGVPVMGTVDQLSALVAKCAVDEILIAVPSATGTQMQRLVRLCEQAAVKFKTVPALQDIITGRVSISQFRDVRLEDLLGRDPVQVDLDSVRKQMEGHVVLVTGSAGTIGSELCRQVLQYNPSRLLCVDQSETGIFYLQLELSERNKNAVNLVYHVADVGDSQRMRGFVLEHAPQVIFHAAAYKHVPVMEWNVHGAVKNNVFALLTLLDMAAEGGCQSFVLISSDKAVNPKSIMGATKRLGELIIAARPTGSMRCVSVRFGNVLGSNGSVVPVLQKQLRNNRPLTITHPDIRRFFMTTTEAVSLVLQAFAIGNHGDTLVLDMGTPVRILDLARTLIRLSGKSEDEVEIKFTGLREGEKLLEELLYMNEEVQPTFFPKIKRIHGAQHRWFVLQRHLEELRASTSIGSADPVRAKMKEIVPEYSYESDNRAGTSVPHMGPSAPKALRQAVGAD